MLGEDVIKGSGPIQQDDKLYNQKTQPVPAPAPEIGVDTEQTFFDTFIADALSSKLDYSAFTSFDQTAMSRNEIYSLLDTLCQMLQKWVRVVELFG